jgi:hypothetical protein
MTSRARLVLSNHRQESVELARQLMMQHDTVILEEAPEEGFEEMLTGRISTDSYLESLDMEYPDFSRAMCRMLRGFYGSGKKIYQIEPFMENLIEIHRRFADGWRPEDLESGTVMHWVYLAERSATGALIRFYETSLQADFDATVEAVKRFARADAARFDLKPLAFRGHRCGIIGWRRFLHRGGSNSLSIVAGIEKQAAGQLSAQGDISHGRCRNADELPWASLWPRRYPDPALPLSPAQTPTQ